MELLPRFNPLQVRYKLSAKQGDIYIREYVSIPYRYATNWRWHLKNSILQQCFNPLQVRYKLEPSFSASLGGKGFQSLIGTLQTGKRRMNILDGLNVSIPYRYATNSVLECVDIFWGVCFNPLQVRYKHMLSFLQNQFLEGFNPLQVRYKPNKTRDITEKELCFNPLQVRYKRCNTPGLYSSPICFNPLQVRYKREHFPDRVGTSKGFNPLQVRYKLSFLQD